MIKFITLMLLHIFDSYNQSKIFNFLKKRGYHKFDIFFDIGAHNGETIKLFLKNFNIEKIFSFEASPINFKKLIKNASKIEKKYQNVQIIIENLAAGSENKKIIIKQLNETSSSTINELNSNSKYYKKKSFFMNEDFRNSFLEVETKQIKLSEYIEKKDLEKIDFLKIDTEGYEYSVLKGAYKTIKNLKPAVIQIEVHHDDQYANQSASVISLLSDYGYTVHSRVRHSHGNFYDYLFVIK